MKTGILSLGTRRDAHTWENQCKQVLGFDVPLPIQKPKSTSDEVRAFFARPVDWIYFGGHFVFNELYNDAHDVSATFHADRVELSVGGLNSSVVKGKDDFKLDNGTTLILWGGCSTLGIDTTVAELSKLFGPHLMIGFQRTTGPSMVDAMLTGGGFIKKPFFTRVSDAKDPAVCRDAWLQAALEGYGGAELEDHFAAVDPDGTRWTIEDKKIKRGKKVF